MRLILSLFLIAGVAACTHKADTAPDVSGIHVQLPVRRFERAFFNLDSNAIARQTDSLVAAYPSFGENFLSTILGIDPKWSPDSTAYYLKGFIAYNRTVYDSAEKTFADFSQWQHEIERGVQFVKYYYPHYHTPGEIITYIGPADGYGDILDDKAFIVGLQAHLGKDFPLYKTQVVLDTYPTYVTDRFIPQTIPVNCLKNIVLDMYPEHFEDKRMVLQMVEKGKRLWLLSKFLPGTDEHLLIGYSAQQLKDCYAHEARIWNLFIENNYLQSEDKDQIKNYVTEGPKTPELGEDAPGNIGSFAGWQIVKKYAASHKKVAPDSLMKMDPEEIFTAAKYKP